MPGNLRSELSLKLDGINNQVKRADLHSAHFALDSPPAEVIPAGAHRPHGDHAPTRHLRRRFTDGRDEDGNSGTESDEDDNGFNTHQVVPAYPFARATNYSTPSPSSPHSSPGPSDSGSPFPRHRSPPPQRSRASSVSHSNYSDAGPRGPRAGSPMPQVPDVDDSEDEDAENEPPSPRDTFTRFKERHSMRVEGTPQAGILSPPEMPPSARLSMRRASENLPYTRPPAIWGFPHDHKTLQPKTQTHAAPLNERSTQGSTQLTRARSLNSKVTFAPMLPRRERARRPSLQQPLTAQVNIK